MGRYTVYNKIVDDVIEKDLKHIVERIKSVKTVRSIVLGGGFGRGEGSVLLEGGNIRPVNDYDIFVAVSDDDKTDFRTMSREIAGELKIRLLDIIPIKYRALAGLPQDQFNYDLKFGSVCLWGEDFSREMPEYGEGQVEPGAARTLVLNRLICAIEAYSEEFESRAMTDEEVFFLVNQTGKIVSASVEALLIMERKYSHSYRRRQEIFETLPGRERLKGLNRVATDFKLRPAISFSGDPVAYWNGAVEEFIEVAASILSPDEPDHNGLWRALKKKNVRITNSPVERIELLLLLYRVYGSFFSKRLILSKARKVFRQVSGEKMNGAGWEALRRETASLWHALCH